MPNQSDAPDAGLAVSHGAALTSPMSTRCETGDIVAAFVSVFATARSPSDIRAISATETPRDAPHGSLLNLRSLSQPQSNDTSSLHELPHDELQLDRRTTPLPRRPFVCSHRDRR